MAVSGNMQKYWYPGRANQRSIFDFTNDVLDIESPGFPLVPEDSDNFGNVITLPTGWGYAIIGKYIVDTNYTVVTGADGIFDRLSGTIANCSFAPDVNTENAAHLYYIDTDGLHYGHIQRKINQESVLDTLMTVSLAMPAMTNSPLAILGNATGEGYWLFYLHQQDNIKKLITSWVEAGVEVASSAILFPGEGIPVSIEVYQNQIALVCDDGCLVYGSLVASGQKLAVTLNDRIPGLSKKCVQCTYSADGNSLFWLSKQDKVHYINYRNLTTGADTRAETVGHYIAVKCGPDQVIYGLSHLTNSSSTLLVITPNAQKDDFSISESFDSANGGYFPSCGWNTYSAAL